MDQPSMWSPALTITASSRTPSSTECCPHDEGGDVTTVADLTPAFLTEVLAGVTGGAAVTAVDPALVGTGQLGECVRLTLTYDRDTTAPTSLVAKLPCTDDTSGAAAAVVRAYEIEVGFYRDLRAGLSVRTPHCFHASLDLDSNDFVLLLEDITAGTQGDQLAGCSVDEAAAAVAQLPGLHAPRWGDASLEQLEWLHRSTEATSAMFTEIIRSLYPGFLDRYANQLSPDVVTLSERGVLALEELNADRPRPWTMAHSDSRLDNLRFPPGRP